MAIMEENNLVTLSGNIRKILGTAIPEGDKERLIADIFINYSEISADECVEMISLAFSMILNDRDVRMAWCILKNLEGRQPSCLSEVVRLPVVESLLTGTVTSPNIQEVPALVKWCLRNGLNREFEGTVRENIVFFLSHSRCKNAVATACLLGSVADLLDTFPSCIPYSTNDLCDLSRAVVEKLATLTFPFESQSVGLLISNMNCVENLLKTIVDNSEDRRVMLANYLRLLYAAVSDPVNCPNPSPTLAIILQVVDTELISGSVQSILADHSDNDSLIRLTAMLCGWLVKWPKATNLKLWILALMAKLEEENRLDVLSVVAQQCADNLFGSIFLPVIRPGALPVLLRMLPHHCLQPETFHKIAIRIPTLVSQLLSENSHSSKEALRGLANMSAECMRMFPGPPQMYDAIFRAFEECWQTNGIAPSPASMSVTHQWHMQLPATRVGLYNLGNTCYMNSILQALFMTRRFCDAILHSNVSQRTQPVLFFLQRLFALLLHSHRPAVRAEDLLRLTRPPGFSPGHQQDSSEFLMYLLDILREQERNMAPVSQPGAGDGEAGPSSLGTPLIGSGNGGGGEGAVPVEPGPIPMEEDEDDEGNEVQGAAGVNVAPPPQVEEQDSIVSGTFGGLLRMRIQCLRCSAESSLTDPFLELQVCFPDEQPESESQVLELQSLVDALLSPERLTGDNRYSCDNCRSLQEGIRTLQLAEPPEYLILILKHFRYSPATRQRMKLMHKVHYTETLEIPVATNPTSMAQYRLYAAVVHSGHSVDAGHYYTIARDEGGNWLRMDDESVVNSSSGELNKMRASDTPYILFYCGASSSLLPPRGSPEEVLLGDLGADLAQFVWSDNALFAREENMRKPRVNNSVKKNTERRFGNDNDDDDDKPGSNCGGQIDMNMSSNRFVY